MNFVNRRFHISMSIRFQFLFVALVLSLALPVVLSDRLVAFLVPLLFTVVTIAALPTATKHPAALIVAILLAVPALLFHWISPRGEVMVPGQILAILFLMWVTLILLRHGLSVRRVTGEILFAAACVYLLLALIWSLGYELAHTFEPETLAIPERLVALGENPSSRGIFTYFSFVTLTTLGYGDVTPISDSARTLAALEAAIGQLFLVIVVARLVGMHAAQQMARSDGMDETHGTG